MVAISSDVYSIMLRHFLQSKTLKKIKFYLEINKSYCNFVQTFKNYQYE